MNLAVTLLTGRRPALLERTLTSLKLHQSAMLEDALVIALHNGGDPETALVLNRHRDLINLVIESPFLGIGAATSFLFQHALELETKYLLHLEDDWEASSTEPEWVGVEDVEHTERHAELRRRATRSWYEQAVELLEQGVFQVRLRHRSEKVLDRHMVTNRPLRWRNEGGHRVTDDAHYTLNPSLINSKDLRVGWPATSERDAQRKFWNAGRRRVAQVEGVWRHIGGEDSLRKRVGSTT